MKDLAWSLQGVRSNNLEGSMLLVFFVVVVLFFVFVFSRAALGHIEVPRLGV